MNAVLLQNNKPVTFYSRKMTDAERNYVNCEQELVTAILALKVFRCYLLGNPSTLITDNKSKTYLDSQTTLSCWQACCSDYLQRFHFSWVHKPGRFNVADPLSRNLSFTTLATRLAVTTRQRRQAQRSATETVTDTVTNIPADAAPAAKRRKRNDRTAMPVNTDPASTEAVLMARLTTVAVLRRYSLTVKLLELVLAG